MKIVFTLLSALSIVMTEDCKCWTPLKSKIEDDKPKCVGSVWTQGDPGKYTLMTLTQPCGHTPLCLCGQRWEAVALFCADFASNGTEIKKWDCQNKEEWDTFKKIQDDEMKAIFSNT